MSGHCHPTPTFKPRLTASDVISQWPTTFGNLTEHGCLFSGRVYCNLAKCRHTIMLLRQYGARQYAAYGAQIHRRHILRLFVVLRAVLCAAIFTKCGCRRPVHIMPPAARLQMVKRSGGNMIYSDANAPLPYLDMIHGSTFTTCTGRK